MTKPVIIAEFGSSPAPAWDFDAWCLAAARSGATHCKVQLFLAEHFPREEWEQKRPLEFPRKRLAEFVKTAHRYSLRAGASVFDAEAVRLVAGECDFIKLAAREQGNSELRIKSWQAYIPIYRSVSKFEFIPHKKLDLETTLITIQKYPAPLLPSLIAMIRFGSRMYKAALPWGYSSHTTHAADCEIAARLGASVIEKHFCLSHDDLEGGHSLTPSEFKRMAERITK